MNNGKIAKPVYQIPLGLELPDIEEDGSGQEKMTSESALTALSALRVKAKDGFGNDIEIAPPWMGMYQRLFEGGWKWRVAVYIAWAAQPKKRRWPETQEELAIKCLGLNSDRAIATWRKKYPSIDETISMLQASIIFDAVPEALQAMVDVATTADYKGHADRKLMMEMTGLYTPSSRLTAEVARKLSGDGDLSDLTDDELRDIEARAQQTREQRTKPDEETKE